MKAAIPPVITGHLPGSGYDPETVGRPDIVGETLQDAIAESLAAVGVAPSAQLVESLEDLAHDLAIAKCAEFLRDLALKMDGTPTGAVFRRVLLADDEPIREAAKRVGVTHQALSKSAGRVARRLGGGCQGER